MQHVAILALTEEHEPQKQTCVMGRREDKTQTSFLEAPEPLPTSIFQCWDPVLGTPDQSYCRHWHRHRSKQLHGCSVHLE